MAFGKTFLFFTVAMVAVSDLQAQRPDDARRGAGLRAGVWQVQQLEGQPKMRRSAAFEFFVQRGLDDHLTVESSVGFWRGTTPRLEDPIGVIVETDSYIVPLMTALKVYPLTGPERRIEPFLLGGIGFALGLADEGDNAIGGGGTSILTGFGFKGAAGVDVQISNVFGLTASTRYQWIRYGEEIAGLSTFKGLGFEGGLTYRFVF